MKEALDFYYNCNKLPDESPLAFCIRQGWADYICQMLLVDYLILNRDRHGANIEVVVDRTRKTVRPPCSITVSHSIAERWTMQRLPEKIRWQISRSSVLSAPGQRGIICL